MDAGETYRSALQQRHRGSQPHQVRVLVLLPKYHRVLEGIVLQDEVFDGGHSCQPPEVQLVVVVLRIITGLLGAHHAQLLPVVVVPLCLDRVLVLLVHYCEVGRLVVAVCYVGVEGSRSVGLLVVVDVGQLLLVVLHDLGVHALLPAVVKPELAP